MRELFDSGCLPRLADVEFDVEASVQHCGHILEDRLHNIWTDTCAKLPSLRRVVILGKRGPFYYPYVSFNNPTITTLEMYRMGQIIHYSPPAGTSRVLQHLRVEFLKRHEAGAGNGILQWRYPHLRVLHSRLEQGKGGARYPAPLIPVLCSEFRALEWIFLDLYPRIPDDDETWEMWNVSNDKPLDPSPLLLELPRLFYLLLRPANWDLSRLPQGWITQELTTQNDTLMLEPQVFSRPCGASNGLVACFKPAASPVPYGQDDEHWHWRRPRYFNLQERCGQSSLRNSTIWY